jgi:hypothetical protein
MCFRTLLLLTASGLWLPAVACGDTLTVRDDDGVLVTVDARWVGERKGVVAIERTDGRIELVPESQIVKREMGPDPEPISCQEMAERLKDEFGEELFRSHVAEPFVVGLILSDKHLSQKGEAKAATCLKKGAEFMKKVEEYFNDFVVKDLRFDLEKSRYPLVLLIFETDDDFMKFATKDTGGRGLSAGAMLGYYSGLSNRLAIRMSECHSMSTPLHEAIHQQAFNRGLMKRLAPIPAWFSEGMATGFEGTGEKINGGPIKINTKYIRAAMRASTVDWDHVVAEDKAFRGDVLAGEAYGQAWCIHWFLVTKYRKQYVEYLKLISEKMPLEVEDQYARTKDFESAFGKTVGKLQSEFPAWLETRASQQKIKLGDNRQVGHIIEESNLGKVEMTAVKHQGAGLVTEGRMKNLSQIRPMSFLITVETDAGTYAEWYLPSIDPQKGMQLSRQVASKQMQNAPPGREERTFRVKVRSAIPDSDTAQAWRRGELPVPAYSGQ